MTIDIVYPLGKGSKWSNNEIKYSIRSLFKYANEEIGRILIIGEKPKFFEYSDRLIHLSYKDHKAKEVNIWEKALHASEQEEISEEFFFINDDHFFLQPFSIENFPHYHKGDLTTFPCGTKPLHNLKTAYDIKSAITLKLLQRHGLSTWHFDIHTPKRYEKSKFIESYKFFRKELYRGNGLLISSSYCNYHKVEPTYLSDLKLRKSNLENFLQTYRDKLLFSISDDIVTPEFIKFMEKIYPDKSPVEK